MAERGPCNEGGLTIALDNSCGKSLGFRECEMKEVKFSESFRETSCSVVGVASCQTLKSWTEGIVNATSLRLKCGRFVIAVMGC